MDSTTRKSKNLPVVIVEQHNDVVPHIHRAIASRRLPFSDVTMIHLDSHPDLLIDPDLMAETVFQPQDLYESLSIENWILPMAFAKHFGRIVWVKPPWAHQIESRRQTVTIGKCSSSGKIRLTSKENYFLTDGLFCPVEDLSDCCEFTLSVVELLPRDWSSLDPSYTPIIEREQHLGTESQNSTCTTESPDNKNSSIQKLAQALLEETKSSSYILDIDLDFFSTANPFKEMLPPNAEAALRRMYTYETLTDFKDEDVIAFTKKRENRLRLLRDVFKTVEEEIERPTENSETDDTPERPSYESDLLCKFAISCEDISDLQILHNYIVSQSDPREVTFTMLHDFGCTLDDTELPHHISTPVQISALMAEWRCAMESLPKPALVTIARSSDDEYCPKDVVDHIQRDVLKSLEEIFGSLDITNAYNS